MNGLIVDSFAGGGGASLGLERALGRHVDIAINHDEGAILMHRANHPNTLHFRENVWKVSQRKSLARILKGRKVDVFWCSPDCRHFSRAKGSKPVSPRVRGLAWVAVHWAQHAQPRIIMLENVREFKEWGPLKQKLGLDGRPLLDLHGNPVLIPDPDRKGHSFKRFVGRLRGLGYAVEFRELDAADYGAPTHRKRLFLIARRDRAPIVWPMPTHAPADRCALLGLQPYRTAAECIDWSLPCPSIFSRQKPLAENTMKRIAKGLQRYVFGAAEPFIVTCNHAGAGFRGHGLNEPSKTLTGARDAHGLVVPYVARIGQTGSAGKVNDLRDPLTTVTSKAEHLLVEPKLAPFIVSPAHSKTTGRGRYEDPVTGPLKTITRTNDKYVVEPKFAPLVMTNTTGHAGGKPGEPLPTVATGNHHYLVAAFIAKHFGGQVGTDIRRPAPTQTVRGTQNQLAAAYLVHLNHGAKQWSPVDEPLRCVTASGQHHAAVQAFLIKYYGTATGQDLANPLDTVTSRERFGLVLIHGEPYALVDIGMRMLTPRELARAQGFPDSYQLTGTKSNQVARIGNSVPPVMAEVLAKANARPAAKRKRGAA